MPFLKEPYMGKTYEILGHLFISVILVLAVGCTSEKSDAKDRSVHTSPTKPVNVVVIIDTSDRVSRARNPRQIEKDLKITENIVNIFEETFVRPSLYIGSKDTLAFVVPEQPEAPPNLTRNIRTPQNMADISAKGRRSTRI